MRFENEGQLREQLAEAKQRISELALSNLTMKSQIMGAWDDHTKPCPRCELVRADVSHAIDTALEYLNSRFFPNPPQGANWDDSIKALRKVFKAK
jgi:hypothetical protein